MLPTLSVVKIGGNIIDQPEACSQFLKRFASVHSSKILIHGGGKIATQIAERLSIPTQMVDGRRITDKPMLDVVTMVYGGLVNKNLVAELQANTCNAIGLTGADAGIIRSIKRPVKTVDYGFVGDIEEVNTASLTAILNGQMVPVIAPLTYSSEGQILNTNADTMASATAVGMSQVYTVNLVYCFEKRGVLSDPDNDSSIIPVIDEAMFLELKASGAINKGMIPKLENALNALKQGVNQVIICHADELEKALTGQAGTLIRL